MENSRNAMVDVPELKRRADNLTDTIRTMRKWGFTVIHDSGGASQSKEEQMQRARVVAAELLAGRDSGCVGPAVDRVATVLLQTAEAGWGGMDRSQREEALVLAGRMIHAARSYERPEFQSGYFEGLVGGWHQCGLINADEMQALRNRMRENLPEQPPAWWNLAARLGL